MRRGGGPAPDWGHGEGPPRADHHRVDGTLDPFLLLLWVCVPSPPPASCHPYGRASPLCTRLSPPPRFPSAPGAHRPNFFLPESFTRLAHSPEEWQAMLRNRTAVFVGGPHRGGTSVLWEALGAHPSVSRFGSRRETGADHSEGMFVQTVYPRFGIGTEFNRGKEGGRGNAKWRPVGLGRYALGPEAEVHWTEEHHSVGPAKQALMLNEFGRHWDLTDKPVLLEKSPPNIVLSRYLQALVNVGNGAWTPEPPTFGGVASAAKFVFISRHPLANAYAHRAMSLCEDERVAILLANWLAQHEWLEVDARHLQSHKRLRIEDLTAEPLAHVEALWHWLGLPARPEHAAQIAATIRPAPNAKYLVTHCASMAAEAAKHVAFKGAMAQLNVRVQAVHVSGAAELGSNLFDYDRRYDLLDDDWRCAELPDAPVGAADSTPSLKDEP
ncbi:hypothetical protein T492DRAFT_432387 [Pavlovales sp. CCMP2436]|nr:hypothetical protein T492DRAFT_432387 [Pavlovales sp. CCMP2436]